MWQVALFGEADAKVIGASFGMDYNGHAVCLGLSCLDDSAAVWGGSLFWGNLLECDFVTDAGCGKGKEYDPLNFSRKNMSRKNDR